MADSQALPNIHVRARRWSGAPDPLDALTRVGRAHHPFMRLARGPGFRGTPWSFLAVAPSETLHYTRAPKRLDEALTVLTPRRVAHDGPAVPFRCGWAGMLGYELRASIECSPAARTAPLGFPSLWLAHYDAVLAWNHRKRQVYVCGMGATRREADDARARLRDLVRSGRRRVGRTRVRVARPPRPRVSQSAYEARVHEARRAILRGDIFQTNVSQRFDARIDGHPVHWFRRLAASQPAPYMTYLDLGEGRTVLSASPERFLRLRGRTLETDPMKGTRPRGATPGADRDLRTDLADSVKDRAELAMIVDLSRNDLARSCRTGTIRVMVPRRLLRFARVHQAIAVVRGTLPRRADRVAAIVGAFPPGSVTGAPKVRAMEILDALEGEGRGPYCGALGWFDAGGDMDLAVAIRTIWCAQGRAAYRVGGGITLGSDPHEEWRETLDKGRGLFAALAGCEDVS